MSVVELAIGSWFLSAVAKEKTEAMKRAAKKQDAHLAIETFLMPNSPRKRIMALLYKSMAVSKSDRFINIRQYDERVFEEEYRLRFFKENGYSRKVCDSCGSPFWSLTDEKNCGDTPCKPFTFIGSPLLKKGLKIRKMRSLFIDFFRKRGHEKVDRFPIIPRWRDDVLLVSASIFDFQPHVTSGLVDPPANPLVISQPCIRIVDVDSVGKTGKHTTSFEMMAHHVFNSKKKKVYWKEQTTAYCHELFTKDLKAKEEDIIYKEKPWIGGGNAGPSLEVIAGGLEVATLVFMNMKRDDKGKIKLEGEKYSPLALNVVDTGYGLERMVWASLGSPTIYDAIYSDVLKPLYDSTGIAKKMRDKSYKAALETHAVLSAMVDIGSKAKILELRKKVAKDLKKKGVKISSKELNEFLETMERIYVVADHSRAVALMLSDGIVPSNIKEGYLARLLLRKTLRALQDLEIDISLEGLVEKNLKTFDDIMDYNKRDQIAEIVGIETKKYEETLKKGKRLVKTRLKKGKVGTKDLLELYDAHGLHPSVVQKMGEELGSSVDVPDDFHVLLAKKHEKEELEVEAEEELDLPSTKMLYYSDSYKTEFDAKVIYSKGGKVALDRTVFYPEGGGQETDTGVLVAKGTEYKVSGVQKIGNVILHDIGSNIPQGTKVHGKLNSERRKSLMRHHTATHLLLGSARHVLGNHIWQAGALKTPDYGRLDISHYKDISDEEMARIERIANEKVLEGIEVTAKEIDRKDAESRYGFALYQGGVPVSKSVRVIQVGDFDVQGCGGTHCTNTNQIGLVKITRITGIQDGVERIEFVAGLQAVDYVQEQESILKAASSTINVPPAQLPKSVKRFFEEWKSMKKRVNRMKEEEASSKFATLSEKAEEVHDVLILADISELDMAGLRTLAKEISNKENMVGIFASGTEGGKIVVARSPDVEIDSLEVAQKAATVLGGSAGGGPDFAQGGGPRSEEVKKAVEVARKEVKALLGSRPS
jgi:alanyl-tRNA synthetase